MADYSPQADYSLYSNAEQLPGEGFVLKKTRAKTLGGMLSGSVQPGAGSLLPNARRARLKQLQEQAAEVEGAEPDITQMQEYAKQRSAGGDAAMLNALAAQFAGESFQPVQAQYLKRAAAAQDPMKLGGGMLTADGQFLRDPFASQERQIGRLDRLIGAEQSAITAAERDEVLREDRLQREEQVRQRQEQARRDALEREERARQERLDREAENRRRDERDHQFRVDNQRFLRSMANGGGAVGAGTATQIGSGLNNEPVFRMRDGRLFTYDQQGQPTAYSGQVLPKAGSSQPTEDERKAAGYMGRINQGLQLINGITQENPSATKPGATATALSKVPVVGNMASNIITPEARQRVEAAQLDMLDAALTLATGAAYTKEQLQGLSKSYFTQIGDDPKTIADKRERLQQIIETARIRAGRALPAAAAAQPGNNSDPLGLRPR